MKHTDKIYIAGHRGLVGSAIWRCLAGRGYTRLVGRELSELDLCDQQATERFFAEERPDYVILAAARVGGIVANNTYRGEFIYDNLMIQNNVIHSAWKHGVKKLLFLGSTCIYPRDCPQPMKEEYLLTAPLEVTNEPYAIAKIAGIKLCESYNIQYGTNFIAVMPTNLYGPNDNFDLEKSHVLPALLRKMHLAKCADEGHWDTIATDLARDNRDNNRSSISQPALVAGLERPSRSDQPSEGGPDRPSSSDQPFKGGLDHPSPALLAALARIGITTALRPEGGSDTTVEIWGSGRPLREFLWVDDMAAACVFMMENVDIGDLARLDGGDPEATPKAGAFPHFVNIGTGSEVSIRALAEMISDVVGYRGKLRFNSDKPDGTMRKLTDPARLHTLGWHHRTQLREGIQQLYAWYTSRQ